jgi:hypothetical protein
VLLLRDEVVGELGFVAGRLLATQTTRHANSPATTKRPWPRASLALLLDGASARKRVLNAETFDTAAAIVTVLIGAAIPTAASR